MDINDFRAGFTLVSLVLFLAIMAWTWARRRQPAFEEAAMLPFIDKEPASRQENGNE
jgi:cytochrome c oxidase cbb3-type subunit 4